MKGVQKLQKAYLIIGSKMMTMLVLQYKIKEREITIFQRVEAKEG